MSASDLITMADGTTPLMYPCSICGAMGRGTAPHGWGVSCPQKVAIDEAYIAMLDAQRMSYIRAGGPMDQIGEAMQKLAGLDEEES